MIAKGTGLILRQVKYGESSVILEILTKEWGVQSYIVSGVRKKNSRNPAAIYQIMNWIDFVAYYKENHGIKRIKEAKMNLTYQLIPYDAVRRCLGIFLVEVIQKTMRQQDTTSSLFDFVFQSFQHLDDHSIFPSNAHVWFLIQLTKYIGISPNGNYDMTTPYFHKLNGVFSDMADGRSCTQAVSQSIWKLLSSEAPLGSDVSLHGELRVQIIEEINEFYKYQIEKFPDFRTINILKQVF